MLLGLYHTSVLSKGSSPARAGEHLGTGAAQRVFPLPGDGRGCLQHFLFLSALKDIKGEVAPTSSC